MKASVRIFVRDVVLAIALSFMLFIAKDFSFYGPDFFFKHLRSCILLSTYYGAATGVFFAALSALFARKLKSFFFLAVACALVEICYLYLVVSGAKASGLYARIGGRVIYDDVGKITAFGTLFELVNPATVVLIWSIILYAKSLKHNRF